MHGLFVGYGPVKIMQPFTFFPSLKNILSHKSYALKADNSTNTRTLPHYFKIMFFLCTADNPIIANAIFSYSGQREKRYNV